MKGVSLLEHDKTPGLYAWHLPFFLCIQGVGLRLLQTTNCVNGIHVNYGKNELFDSVQNTNFTSFMASPADYW